MQQNAMAIILIGASMFIPLWIGTKAGGKEAHTLNDFFVHSRNMGIFPMFFTVQATWWSAFAFIGATSSYYENGPVYWTTIGWDVLFGVLFYVLGKRIWFYGKKGNYITATDFFMDIYQCKPLGILVTGIIMLFTIPYFELQITGGTYLIEVISGGLIPSQMGAFLFTAVIVIYVWTGGLRAVAWADVFYELLIILSAILGGIFVLKQYGGIEALFSEMYLKIPEALTLPGPHNNAGPLLWISMFLIVPAGAIMAPPLWIRMYDAKDEQIFNKLPFFLALISILNLAAMMIGNAGLLLEPDLAVMDYLFPLYVMKYAPYVIAYVILIGGAAAAMSTANSQIHSISATYTIDIHRRYIRKNLEEHQLITIGRIVIVLFAILSYLAYLYLPGLIIQLGLIALSGTAQLIVPTIGALTWKRSNGYGALTGLFTGLALLFSLFYLYDMAISYAALIAVFGNALAFIAVSLLLPKQANTKNKIAGLKELYQEEINKKNPVVAKRRRRMWILLLFGFSLIEFPGIYFINRIEPKILGMPFLYGFVLITWIGLCAVLFYAYLTDWGAKGKD
jgi:SSS family solute:Na+ symporter